MPLVKRGGHIDLADRCFEKRMNKDDEPLIITRGDNADESRDIRVQIDGEPRDFTLPVTITWHPDQVSVMAPKQGESTESISRVH